MTAKMPRDLMVSAAFGLKRALVVNDEDNLCYFVAKIMAAYNPTMAQMLKDTATKKRESFKDMELTIESFG